MINKLLINIAIGILGVVFVCFPLYSQENGETFEIMESVNDSIDLRSNFYDDTDSLSEYFPASELYESWDNNGIYYPHVDFSKKTDTTVLILSDNVTNFYAPPVKGRINSEYGYRRRRFHYGIDLDLDIGDSVKSAFDGMVRIAKYHRGYGNVAVVRHFNGLETVYGHLSGFRVRENQVVKAGELLGYGGSTGRSTGPHLHFEVRYLGTPMNPKKIIDFEKFKLLSDTLFVTNRTFDKSRSTTYAHKSTSSGKSSYTSKGNYHYVKKGDTLGHIAGKYGTSVSALCKLNRLTAKSILQIGQKIRIR
ncbi:MAG TPA: M23 family metallopeptidase [Bacteroidales bacterium]|nr:M23 family metallopeptidase [Bacteroidales bacterium]